MSLVPESVVDVAPPCVALELLHAPNAMSGRTPSPVTAAAFADEIRMFAPDARSGRGGGAVEPHARSSAGPVVVPVSSRLREEQATPRSIRRPRPSAQLCVRPANG